MTLLARAEDRHHKHAIYLDLEWTCWNTVPPAGMKQEIIEVGIVAMDLANLKLLDEASYFVRPRRWEISQKCTMITGITDQDIRSAKPLGEVHHANTALQVNEQMADHWDTGCNGEAGPYKWNETVSEPTIVLNVIDESLHRIPERNSLQGCRIRQISGVRVDAMIRRLSLSSSSSRR